MPRSFENLSSEVVRRIAVQVDQMEYMNVQDELMQLRRLKIASLLEGTTLLALLIIAAPLKHLFDWPTGVQILGPIHGFAVLAYLWLALQTTASAPYFSRAEGFRLVILALVPLGVFFNDALLSRKIGQLREKA